MERYRRPLPCISHYGYIFALSTFAFNLSKLDKQNKKCPLHFGRLRPYGALTLAFAFSFNTLLFVGRPTTFLRTYLSTLRSTEFQPLQLCYLPFGSNNSAPLLVLSSLFDGAKLVHYFLPASKKVKNFHRFYL